MSAQIQVLENEIHTLRQEIEDMKYEAIRQEEEKNSEFSRNLKRKIIYTTIYVGVAVAFPTLPLYGIKFLWGIGTGIWDGVGTDVKWHMTKEAVTQVRGPLWGTLPKMGDAIWKAINPFE